MPAGIEAHLQTAIDALQLVKVSPDPASHIPLAIGAEQEKPMRSTRSNGRLRLAAHVRACEIDGQVILLDLKANRYIGVASTASSRLSDRVDGWPSSCAGKAQAASSASINARDNSNPGSSDRFTENLVSRGLLWADLVPGRPVTHTSPELPEATASLDLGDIGANCTPGARSVAILLKSALRAAWWLRTRSLHSIALAVAGRRERHERHGQRRRVSRSDLDADADTDTDTDTLELAQMMQCAVVYERLRPLMLSANEKCLFDSLTLISFLAVEGLFPRWVIGVKTGPFGAHSWVQAGSTVLNDQHEHVRRFRPILVV